MSLKELMMLGTVVISSSLFGQAPKFWGSLSKGPYEVGYKDTLLLKSDENYEFKDYKGAKPFYTKIWYPAIIDGNKTPVKYGEYMEYSAEGDLKQVSKYMERWSVRSLKRYGVRDNLDKGRVALPNLKSGKIYKTLMNTETAAILNLPEAPGKFPVIYYHHGYGGTNDDNSVFCEYMASQGYVVISSNYFWVYNSSIGTNYTLSYPSDDFNDKTDLTFVVDATSGLENVDTTQRIYCGHSWGAQLGFRLNNSDYEQFKFFLLFDTTYERYDTEMISKSENTKEFQDVINESALTKKTPMVLVSGKTVAYTKKGVKLLPIYYDLFRGLIHTPLFFITLDERLDHNSYVSLGVMRGYYHDQISQKDGKTVHAQTSTFERMVNMCHYLIKSTNDISVEELNQYACKTENANQKE